MTWVSCYYVPYLCPSVKSVFKEGPARNRPCRSLFDGYTGVDRVGALTNSDFSLMLWAADVWPPGLGAFE